jgi:hypothetical protein
MLDDGHADLSETLAEASGGGDRGMRRHEEVRYIFEAVGWRPGV